MADWAPCYDCMKWSPLVCGEVKYELSPTSRWAGDTVMYEEKASD